MKEKDNSGHSGKGALRRGARKLKLAMTNPVYGAFHALRGAPGLLYPYFLMKYLNFNKRACGRLSGESFDCLFVHDIFPLPAAIALKSKRGCEVVFDSVEIPEIRSRSGKNFAQMPRWLNGYILRKTVAAMKAADRVFTVGDAMAQHMQSVYGVKVEALRNARDAVEIIPGDTRIRAAAGLRDGDRLALYINTASPGKVYGVEATVAALAHLPENIHLGFLGKIETPQFQQQLASLAESLSVARRLHFLGMVDYGDMPQYASGANAGIVPLYADNLNIKNAMANRIFDLVAARLPIVTSAIPDHARLVEGYAIGAVIGDETSPQSIAAAIEKALENEPEFRANAARAAAELNWESERKKLQGALGDRKKKIIFLTWKRPESNARIRRQAQFLQSCGHNVSIACPFAVKEKLPGIGYIRIETRL